MTLFLLWWLTGEAVYWQLSRGEPEPDLGLVVEMLEEEARREFAIEEPREIALLRRICLVVVMTVFFLTPLIWPLLFLNDGDDDLP